MNKRITFTSNYQNDLPDMLITITINLKMFKSHTKRIGNQTIQKTKLNNDKNKV